MTDESFRLFFSDRRWRKLGPTCHRASIPCLISSSEFCCIFVTFLLWMRRVNCGATSIREVQLCCSRGVHGQPKWILHGITELCVSSVAVQTRGLSCTAGLNRSDQPRWTSPKPELVLGGPFSVHPWARFLGVAVLVCVFVSFFLHSWGAPFSSISFFRDVYERLVIAGTIIPKPEKKPPTVPMDYSWAQVSESEANLYIGFFTLW